MLKLAVEFTDLASTIFVLLIINIIGNSPQRTQMLLVVLPSVSVCIRDFIDLNFLPKSPQLLHKTVSTWKSKVCACSIAYDSIKRLKFVSALTDICSLMAATSNPPGFQYVIHHSEHCVLIYFWSDYHHTVMHLKVERVLKLCSGLPHKWRGYRLKYSDTCADIISL